MRITIDPRHLNALHDFLARAEWDVARDGDALVVAGHPLLAHGESDRELLVTLNIWRIVHPAASTPQVSRPTPP